MSSVLLLLLLVLLVHWDGGEAARGPPKFRIRGRGRADPGKTVTLSCHFLRRSSASPSSYEWTKDGEVIPGETRGTLTLTPVTTQDAGIYQCGDPNSTLERLEHNLSVSGARLPQPRIGWRDLEVLGRSFVLECYFKKLYIPNANTVYTWYKDGAEMEGQSSQVLRFPTVREADTGKYTCTAREGPETTTSPVSDYYHLLPLASPEVRITPASPDNVTKGILGENLTLTCEETRAFPGVPADGYSWSYLPSLQGQRRPLVGKASNLTLGPLTREDGGQYFCQARNDQDFPDFNLNLTGHASVTVHIVYLDNITLTPDLKVKVGDSVALTCSVDSHPAARLAWTVHGQEVRHVTGNLDHYVILSAGCSDSTSYTCGASNPDVPGREMSASTRLRVEPCSEGGEATPTSKKFLIRGRWRAHPGETVTLSCHFLRPSSASPSSYVWTKDGEVIPGETRDTLTLTPVTSQDAGIYQCGDPNSNLERLEHHLYVSDGAKMDFSQVWWMVLAAVIGFVVIHLAVFCWARCSSRHTDRNRQAMTNSGSASKKESIYTGLQSDTDSD